MKPLVHKPSRKTWFWGGGVVGALVLIYLAAAAMATSAPDGTTIAGVDVGGLSGEEIQAKLEGQLGDRLTKPISVRVGTSDRSADIDPKAARMAPDYDATTRPITGFSLAPNRLWQHLSGGGPRPLIATADDKALADQVAAAAEVLDGPPVDGAIAFEGPTAVAVPAQNGYTVRRGEAAQVVRSGWLGADTLTLPADETRPGIEQAAVDAAMKDFAEPAMSGPLQVVVGQTTVPVPPQDVASTLSFAPEAGKLKPAVDGEKLRHYVMTHSPQLGTEAKDATVKLQDGNPVVVPGVAGTTIDTAQLTTNVLTALPTPEKKAVVASAVAEPKFTTAQAEALGIKEVVSEFAVNLTGDGDRTHNIAVAAGEISGYVLKPGETFSLNKVVTTKTPEKGYRQAPVIQGGKLKPEYGGGVSQVATTLYNGMYFAGLKDVEHKAHSFYISRYPAGREATVYYPQVDLKFTNDTKYGVLIEIWVEGGKSHTRFWSTKHLEVESIPGPRTNYRPPATINATGPGCTPQSPAEGFDIVVERIVRQGGAELRRDSVKTAYSAEDRVVCS